MRHRILMLAAVLAFNAPPGMTRGAVAQTPSSFQPTYEDGVARRGQDYRSFHPIGPSALYCQQACLAEPRCHAWSYDSPAARGDRQPICWLKGSVPAQAQARGIVSGVVRPDETSTADVNNTNQAQKPVSAPPPAPTNAEPAKPDCQTDRYNFSAVLSQSVSVNSVSSGGSPCTYSVAPLHPDVVTFTSARIVKKSNNGTFEQVGIFSFRYQPTRGFKGGDEYAIEVCGHNRERSGCATITYRVTVQ
jgi:PAN domain-containing protein